MSTHSKALKAFVTLRDYCHDRKSNCANCVFAKNEGFKNQCFAETFNWFVSDTALHYAEKRCEQLEKERKA